MKGKHIEFALGIVVGAALFGGSVAYGAGLLAERSYQPIYVDGQQVSLEAYAINGHNYVKLRDIGQAVGFEVYWDNDTGSVQVVSDQPYTGLPPVQTPAPADQDHSQQANPAIFTGELTREVYNAVRDTVVNRETILSGSREPQTMSWSTEAYQAMDTVTAAMGNYPAYEALSLMGGKLACGAKSPETYAQAVSHTQPFVDSLSSMSQHEQVKAIARYICERMTYSTAITSPTTILASDSVSEGNCMSYAHSFLFLCDRADIPCILLHSETHQWNKVYVDGRWWDVDISSTDAGDDMSNWDSRAVVYDGSDFQGTDFINAAPEITAFAMEVFVPGSTK